MPSSLHDQGSDIASIVEDAESHDAFCNSQHERVISNALLWSLVDEHGFVRLLVHGSIRQRIHSVQRWSELLSHRHH